MKSKVEFHSHKIFGKKLLEAISKINLFGFRLRFSFASWRPWRELLRTPAKDAKAQRRLLSIFEIASK
ncbi:MAG: hypothetical protein ACR2GD_08000 [Pyrinomonadaceae bacterium]